jgi:hypothetical protein
MNKNAIPSDNIQPIPSNKWTKLTSHNIIIAILVSLLVLSVLGINLLVFVGQLLQMIVNLIRPIFDGILGIIFYYIGASVNISADVASDVARTGINIAEGTAHSVGNLLQNEDNVDGPLPEQTDLYKKVFDVTPLDMVDPVPITTPSSADIVESGVNVATLMTYGETAIPVDMASPDKSLNNDLDETIEKELKPDTPSMEASPSWCLVGQYGGKRSCMSLEGSEICESGQTYASQKECLQLHKANAADIVATTAVAKKEIPVTTYTKNWGIAPPIPPPASMSPPMGTGQKGYSHIPVVPQLPNPYYGSIKYRNIQGIPNVNYTGPNTGEYLHNK